MILDISTHKWHSKRFPAHKPLTAMHIQVPSGCLTRIENPSDADDELIGPWHLSPAMFD